jgi:UPF0755 protein
LISFLKDLFRHLVVGLLITASLLLTILGAAHVYFNSPGPLKQSTVLIFEQKESLSHFSKKLALAKVIKHDKPFKLAMQLVNVYFPLKAGEYKFNAHITPKQILHILVEGKSLVHKFRLVEGTMVKLVLDQIMEQKVLVGDIDYNVPEGYLLPDTYFFTYGDNRATLVNLMKEKMRLTLDELWESRDKTIPIKTKEEALTLASIIEKETSLASERKKVAAVYVNRLKKGMKLQADPTTIYGITHGQFQFNRQITRADLMMDSPYNTYYIKGLPPHAIAIPSRASIEAALNPANTKDIFFVANGLGGHNFSETLRQHNEYVRAYRNR